MHFVSHGLAAGLVLMSTPAWADADSPAPQPAMLVAENYDHVAIGEDRTERMTVAVSVAGKGPYRFLVDTGSERTVISRELATRLGLAGGRDAVVHSVLGANRVSTVRIPSLSVSNIRLAAGDAPALKASNIGADGLLGIDSLQHHRVMFDFKGGTMSVLPASLPVARLDGDTIIVRARSRNGRLIFTDAELGGRKIAVVVDTGSQISIANLAALKALRRRGGSTLPDPVAIETVTGEQTIAEVARLQGLRIGGLAINELAVAFADAHIFRELKLDRRPAILLGMNAIRAFDQVSIDFASRKIRFVLPESRLADGIRMALLIN
ncbi:retroviral-like aspartic protease family protein [Sphingomonas xanthus]|nr:retroviral-like aspartic protease family protein [Sphingomonas xanthus]